VKQQPTDKRALRLTLSFVFFCRLFPVYHKIIQMFIIFITTSPSSLKYLKVGLIPTVPAALLEIVNLIIISKYSNSALLDCWIEKILIKKILFCLLDNTFNNC